MSVFAGTDVMCLCLQGPMSCVCVCRDRCHVPVFAGTDVMCLCLQGPMSCVCVCRDRCHAPVNLNVVHGTIMSFVEMEKFKTKQSTKVTWLI